MAGLPLIYNVIISFQRIDVFSLGSLVHPFVGWENYARVLGDPLAARVLVNTIVCVAASIFFQFTIGFAFALFLDRDFPGAAWLRGVFLAAWVMPGLVVGVLRNWLLSGDFGVISDVPGARHHRRADLPALGRPLFADVADHRQRLVRQGAIRMAVGTVEATGSATYLFAGGEPEIVVVTPGNSAIRPGETIAVGVAPEHVHVFDAGSGISLAGCTVASLQPGSTIGNS